MWSAGDRDVGKTHRQRGEFQAAEQSFRQALAVARDQGAILWQLKAATSYARSLRDRSEPEQAHALLAPIYGWLSEGFDTALFDVRGCYYIIKAIDC
jgi:Tfp pilus assembly protein PilF